ncbi:MAG: phosphoheptose isomerase [Rhodospirillaceae bacterium]|jgi:phosphoheptose isomerase|nr:phosphoheptose isomerase [Rhodospirillaceae bacterium]
MTFPDSKFASVADYAVAYFDQAKAAAQSVDQEKLEAALTCLDAAYERGGTIYACGNGGSAAISNHLACDHSKGGQTDTDLKPKVVSLSTNMEIITAIANDISFDDIFVYQLRTLAEDGDVLLTISSSGDSENVVRAARWAKEKGLDVIAFTGFDGGRSAKLATVNLHVEGDNYGVVEDTHQSLMHILAQYIRLKRMDDGTIQERKF